jgi:hypothetical protein
MNYIDLIQKRIESSTSPANAVQEVLDIIAQYNGDIATSNLIVDNKGRVKHLCSLKVAVLVAERGRWSSDLASQEEWMFHSDMIMWILRGRRNKRPSYFTSVDDIVVNNLVVRWVDSDALFRIQYDSDLNGETFEVFYPQNWTRA